ncbi:MAG: lytic transglycosylase domain-containing protein [Chlamydiota bacterium]|nr:lytic transglycosylase domain-containing protein [Chlamydiota bacterium]
MMRCFIISLIFTVVFTCGFSQDEQSGYVFDEALFDEFYNIGETLTESYLPGISEDVELPSYEEWKIFWIAFMDAMQSLDYDALAGMQEEGAGIFETIDQIPVFSDYADWLYERLDYADMARQTVMRYPIKKQMPQVQIEPVRQERTNLALDQQQWKKKLSSRALPEDAQTLIPILKEVFKSEGVPPEWVWIAEVESSFNPKAKSPVGALGLFQFMPQTAERFGLKTGVIFDDRKNPEKSAKAAAQYLKILYRQFKSWPLVFAAYNAGEGRVGRLLKKHHATDFEQIAVHLPVETQMYVPKIMATVALREHVDPLTISAPRE